MAINRIVTGQTFGNWLDTTNKIIDEINEASSVNKPNKLVRYSSTGSLSIKDFTANSILLANGTRIDRISTNYTTHEDDNTILTANAIYAAIRAEDKTSIKDTPAGVPANSRVTANSSTRDIELVVDNDLKVLVSNTVTTFKTNVTIDGDLYVKGDTVEFTTETLQIEDNNIILNLNGTYDTAENSGFDVQSTNAHFRLVNTGNRFPVYNIEETVELNNTWKLFRINNVDHQRISMNQKDRLRLTYNFDPLIPMSNTVPLAIGTTKGFTRELNVLEPSTDTIEYKIGATVYNTYADYKAAFLNTASATTATITFNPKNYGLYYYWAGNIVNEKYVQEVIVQTTPDGKLLIDFPSGDSVSEENPTIKLNNGDEFKFIIDLTKAGQRDNYFAISKKPFSDPTRTDVPYTSNIIYDTPNVTYEIDGQYFDSANSKYFADYVTEFSNTAHLYANVTFRPNGEIGNYYYWTSANNQLYDTGGVIEVSANNMMMGGEISVDVPFGVEVSRTAVINSNVVELDTIPNEHLTINAGDTIKITNQDSPIVISSDGTSANALDYEDGVYYELDGDRKTVSDYIAGFAGAAVATITFTPDTASTYYYHPNGIDNQNGEITVEQVRDKKLGAYSFKTDDHTAVFENENSFRFTKRHNNLMTMDGEFADFSGTKNGIVLPSDSIDYIPAQNGIIRYNPTLAMFEGFSSGQWRGLGGVVDLNQDTYVNTHDADDIIYFSSNGTMVSELSEEEYYLNTFKTLNSNTGEVKIASNMTLGEFSVESTQNTNSVVKTSSIVLNGEGLNINSAGYLQLPIGTAADRPVLPANGMIRFNQNGLQIHDAVNNTTENVHTLELWNGDTWQNLTTIVNEYSINIINPTYTVTVTELMQPFDKNEIDVYVDGLRIQKSDYALSDVPNGNYYDSTLTFTSLRKQDQIITIVNQPSRKIGVSTIDVVSRSELLNGFSSDVYFSGVTYMGSQQESSSIDTGALVVRGGVGISKDLFVGKSITELSAGALKTNVTPIDSALNKVQQLKGVEFNWIDREDDEREYGLIAEDVAKITPSLVSFSQNKAQGVKYSKVVALLIEAIKQQQGEIDELKSKINTKRTRKSKAQ